MVEFGDYQCQNCTKFHNETLNRIINNYVDTGAIKFLFKDFIINEAPYDSVSILAARASYCAADQGKYWQYHDDLYNNSKGGNTIWITKQSLKQFARNVKVPDLTKFSECIDSQKYNDVVMENVQLGQAIGLKSAPTFIFVREGKEPLGIVGAQPFKVFQGAITQLESNENKPTLDSIKITKSPLDTGTKWRKYNSTLGLSLDHPSNWTVEQFRDEEVPYDSALIMPLVHVLIY